MPFGKHKGVPLASVPSDYLRWMLRSIDLYDDLKSDVERVLVTRGGDSPLVTSGKKSKRRRKRKRTHNRQSSPYSSGPTLAAVQPAFEVPIGDDIPFEV